MKHAEELWRTATRSPKAQRETEAEFWRRVAYEMLGHVETLVSEVERWQAVTSADSPDEAAEYIKDACDDEYKRGYDDRKDEEDDE